MTGRTARPKARSSLPSVDYRSDPGLCASALGISREAAELHYASEVIDLHVDSFIWTRLFGYDLLRRHGLGPLRAHFFSQADLPRALEGGLTGAIWSITTNPLHLEGEQLPVFLSNLALLRRTLGQATDQLEFVGNVAQYWQARRAGKHAAFIGVQGGNPFAHGAVALDQVPQDLLLRVTLVHLTSSPIGVTSSPLHVGRDTGLTARGRDLVAALNSRRILVDLSHASPRTFWDAISVHERTQPLVVSHTGVSGVHRSWRNLDDAQLRAVAATGGTIGVIFESGFLGDSRVRGRADAIVNHLSHIVSVVGEDHASLGSDWDGAIHPPRDLPSCAVLARLTHLLLERGFSPDRIRKILGLNFLRVLRELRG